MSVEENLVEFAGKPVRDWKPETGIADPDGIHYRITLDWDELEEGISWIDRFAAFLEDPNAAKITGLVVGNWGEEMQTDGADAIIEALVAVRERLPQLTALFLSDITSEECEISWIVQGDVSPLFTAFPNLEYFGVRGSQSLSFGGLCHARLKWLAVQCGGLPLAVLNEVLNAQLPALEHLELWLGDGNYGWDGTLEDLMPLLQGGLFPNLLHLGLRDSEIADQLAIAIANSPLLARLKVLDLSLGTLSDEGAKALLASPHIHNLLKLDLHHHYLSDEMKERVEALDIETDTSEQENEDQYGRYVAVGE